MLAPRDPRVGPQGVPVNKTAEKAGVVAAATDPAYRLTVDGDVASPLSLSLDDLRAMPQRTADPADRVRRRLERDRRVDRRLPARPARARRRRGGSSAVVRSIQKATAPYASAEVNRQHAADPDTLLALELNGEPLALDHGFPVRLIGPNRPGVLQTKWVARVEVVVS